MGESLSGEPNRMPAKAVPLEVRDGEREHADSLRKTELMAYIVQS